ncbi:MAG: endonuclease MutS2 [Chloroflexota bacterium]|nr:endonuclease MutS2 [Chloroflexota bacterium]MDE2907710.1 endonuclease MutS2 [Chloroflexota bacterium]
MISEKTLATLELHKILQELSAYTTFGAGEEFAIELYPSTELEEVRLWQRETAEAVALLEERPNVTVRGARDVREPVIKAQRGVIVEPSVLLDIRYTLRRGTTLKRTLGRMGATFPLLAELASEIEECLDLQNTIEKTVDDNAEIKDTASARLAIIRRGLKVALDRLQNKLNRIVANKANQAKLQEAIVTMRNGRYVIPLKAEHKGKIKGILHDSSASGATIFIEPLETVELNNKWRELQVEEEKEIRRILADLTNQIAAESERIARTVQLLGYLDLTFAKARYAIDNGCVQPKMVGLQPRPSGFAHPGATVQLKAARHPLLKGKVVPLDLSFDDDTWVLVVTGPNTGGKTVALKTVGLIVMMAQCGLQVPADEAALSVFQGVFADIGDEQSIEQSLSTFSSHMTNIIDTLERADHHSLVILDEVGAGTDPTEGSALARALLNCLRNRGVTTMVTTHHPELKVYGVETAGVRNASVEFDLETLQPTYRLIVGLPGRSNALAIAERLGLDPAIVADARGLVATEDLEADDLLDEIQRTRAEIRLQHAELEHLQGQMTEQRDELQARLDNIEDERRDVIRAARRHAEDDLADFNKQLRRMRGEMRSAGMPAETLNALKAAADKMANWTNAPLDDDEMERLEDIDWAPRVGDTVFLESLNAEGVIAELDDKEAQVQVGALRVRARFRDMRRRTRSEKRAAERGHVRKFEPAEAQLPKSESPGMELDIRGQRVDDALEILDRYINAAYNAGLPFGRIIHGKGTGRLRQAVRGYLSEHLLVSKVTQGQQQEGGAGVTVIHMAPIT